jgi:hypothetical protein
MNFSLQDSHIYRGRALIATVEPRQAAKALVAQGHSAELASAIAVGGLAQRQDAIELGRRWGLVKGRTG